MNESPKLWIFFPNELICCASITGSVDMDILNFFKKNMIFKVNFLH